MGAATDSVSPPARIVSSRPARPSRLLYGFTPSQGTFHHLSKHRVCASARASQGEGLEEGGEEEGWIGVGQSDGRSRRQCQSFNHMLGLIKKAGKSVTEGSDFTCSHRVIACG